MTFLMLVQFGSLKNIFAKHREHQQKFLKYQTARFTEQTAGGGTE